MFVTENDLRRIINKEMSPEQAKRRARTLEQAKGARARGFEGIALKPGVVVPVEKAEKQ